MSFLWGAQMSYLKTDVRFLEAMWHEWKEQHFCIKSPGWRHACSLEAIHPLNCFERLANSANERLTYHLYFNEVKCFWHQANSILLCDWHGLGRQKFRFTNNRAAHKTAIWGRLFSFVLYTQTKSDINVLQPSLSWILWITWLGLWNLWCLNSFMKY